MALPSVSILIPTHNRVSILRRTLESLTKISVPADLTVECIVVANACTDDTVALTQSFIPLFDFPLSCVEEATPGLNVARNTALNRATGDILAYLDDDVWVDEKWLGGLVETFTDYPADIVGGRVVLWWEEVRTPKWVTAAVTSALSASDHGDAVLEYDGHGYRALGANVAFRRSVFERVGPFRPGLDRTGALLLGGGEIDQIRRALDVGCRLFYSPNALVKHWVSAERATKPHLRSRQFWAGISSSYAFPAITASTAFEVLGVGSAKLAAHAALDLAHLLSGNEGKSMDHRLMWAHYAGSIRGLINRWLGRSPVAR